MRPRQKTAEDQSEAWASRCLPPFPPCERLSWHSRVWTFVRSPTREPSLIVSCRRRPRVVRPSRTDFAIDGVCENFARHESGVGHTTRSFGARIRHRRSGGDDPWCCPRTSPGRKPNAEPRGRGAYQHHAWRGPSNWHGGGPLRPPRVERLV